MSQADVKEENGETPEVQIKILVHTHRLRFKKQIINPPGCIASFPSCELRWEKPSLFFETEVE